MSVRSRAQNRSRSSSNSSAPSSSRVRSTTTREKSSPYGSIIRHSTDDQNNLSSRKSKQVNKKRNSLNESHLSDEEQQINVVPDQNDDDETPQNTSNTTIQVNNSQSSTTNTTLTATFQQNLSLNDNTITISAIANDTRRNTDRVASNIEVNKSFDQTPNGLFRCKLCQQELKTKRYVTTNLRKHLGLVHKRIEFLYPSQRKIDSFNSSLITLERKKELHAAVISCIIQDSRSFNDFRKSGMLQFLAVAIPSYVPPHRVTVKNHLKQRYLQHRERLRVIFSKVPAVAITSDVWKNSRGTSFICVTAHFYDNKYNLISLTIGFRRLVGSHIAERLRKYILYEITSCKIQNKICSITTDNGSNIVSATANIPYFGTRISCLAHILNLIVQDGVPLWDDKKVDSTNSQPSSSNNKKTIPDVQVVDEDTSESSSDEEDEQSTADGTDELNDKQRNQDESFEDEDTTDFDDSTPSTDDTLTNVQNLIVRTRCFIKFIRSHCHIHDYLKQKVKQNKLTGHGVILDCIIRWNSSFYMIDRFINYQDIINEITINPRLISASLSSYTINSLKHFMFHHEAWERLTSIRNILAKFEEACQLISGKRYQTLSIGFLVLIGLKHHLSKPVTRGQQTEIEYILKKQLYDAYCFHIQDKISVEQMSCMMISCFLDPETFFLMDETHQDEAQQYIISEARKRGLHSKKNPYCWKPVLLSETFFGFRTVRKLFQKSVRQQIYSNNNSSSASDSISTTRSTNKATNQLNNFLAGCGINPHVTTATNANSRRTIKEELAYYVNKVERDISFEEFWINNENELRCLAAIVRAFNIRPVTSVPSESLFSTAAYVNRKQRSSLSPDVFRYSMILRDEGLVETLLETNS